MEIYGKTQVHLLFHLYVEMAFFSCALQNYPFQTLAFTYVQMGLS